MRMFVECSKAWHTGLSSRLMRLELGLDKNRFEWRLELGLDKNRFEWVLELGLDKNRFEWGLELVLARAEN